MVNDTRNSNLNNGVLITTYSWYFFLITCQTNIKELVHCKTNFLKLFIENRKSTYNDKKHTKRVICRVTVYYK